jgi:hypothetical protein
VFIVPAKTLMVEILSEIFDGDTIGDDFGGGKTWIGMEYPAETTNYPGIWVDFTTSVDLQAAAIDPYEFLPQVLSDQGLRKVQRWRFAGTYSFTVVGMSSLERDNLLDTVIRVIAFGSAGLSMDFKHLVEQNDLIGLTMQYDRFGLVGGSANPGTPWGTEDVVYEETVQIDCEGEFLSDPATGAIVPLSQVVVSESPDNNPGDIVIDKVTANAPAPFVPPAPVPSWNPTMGI